MIEALKKLDFILRCEYRLTEIDAHLRDEAEEPMEAIEGLISVGWVNLVPCDGYVSLQINYQGQKMLQKSDAEERKR